MEQYNKQDINLLEAIYDELKPWMSNHPNLSLLEGVRNCPICGSDVVTKQGRRATHRGLQQQWKCLDCGGWSSSPVGKKLPNYDG